MKKFAFRMIWGTGESGEFEIFAANLNEAWPSLMCYLNDNHDLSNLKSITYICE